MRYEVLPTDSAYRFEVFDHKAEHPNDASVCQTKRVMADKICKALNEMEERETQ